MTDTTTGEISGSVGAAVPAHRREMSADPAPATTVTVGPPRASFVSRWLPALAALVVVASMLVVVGTSPLDIARYGAYVVWCLVLPGTLVYRALRRSAHSLIDDLAMGVAVGLALEIAAWAAFGAIGAQQLLWLWPLAVIIPFVAAPSLRRHWRRPAGYLSPSVGWSWVLAGIVVFAVGYLVVAVLWNSPAVPAGAGAWYHRDDVYLLSLIGEAKLHFPVMASTIAGEPLHYHIFAYTHMASASLVSGVDAPVVLYQLDLPFIIALPAILLAVVGWRVSGKPWVGVLGAALMFLIGEFTHGFRSANGIGTTFAYYSYSSPSQTFAWILAFALLGALTSVLLRDLRMPRGVPRGVSGNGTGGPTGGRTAASSLGVPAPVDDHRPVSRGEWVLLAILALAACGSKATVLPIALAGLGLAGLVELIRRRRIGTDLLIAAAILLGAQIFALAVLFRFESSGLQFAPLYLVPVRDTWTEQGLVYLASGVTYAIYMFARLAGIPVLARLTGRSWGRREYFLLGAILAGWIGAVSFGHPGLGQNFFMTTAFGFGAILSAMGLAALIERHRLSAGIVALVIVGVAIAAFEIDDRLRRWPKPMQVVAGWNLRGDGAILNYAVVVGLIGLVVAAVWLLAVRRRVPRGVGVAVVLSAIMLAGLPTLMNDARTMQRGAHFWHVFITADQATSARWLRDHSSPDDLVATNEHCVDGGSGTGAGCLSLSYWLAGYSERRQLVGSWSYTPKVTSEGGGNAFVIPFWDQQLLHDNDIVFTEPTAQRVSKLRVDHGVRWLVVNREVAPESSALSQFARLRYERGEIAIYELTR